MSRTYTKKHIANLNINNADNFNVDLDGVLQEFNGKLDMHNMPLASVDDPQLFDVVLEAGADVDSSIGPVNDYHITGDDDGPWQWDYALGDWKIGWNPFSDQMTEKGSTLTFDAEEGIVKGSVVADVERRSTAINTTDPVVHTEFGTGNWYEVGVFLNDRLLCRSGRIYARRMTLDLPFATYAGNENVTVNVRWRGINKQPDIGLVGYVEKPFIVHSSTIWARMQKR